MEFGIALHKLQNREAKSIYRNAWIKDKKKVILVKENKNTKYTGPQLYIKIDKEYKSWIPQMSELVEYTDWLVEKKQSKYEKELLLRGE